MPLMAQVRAKAEKWSFLPMRPTRSKYAFDGHVKHDKKEVDIYN